MMNIKGINIQENSIGLWGTYNKVSKGDDPTTSYPAKVKSNPFADLNLDYIGVVYND